MYILNTIILYITVVLCCREYPFFSRCKKTCLFGLFTDPNKCHIIIAFR